MSVETLIYLLTLIAILGFIAGYLYGIRHIHKEIQKALRQERRISLYRHPYEEYKKVL